MRACGFSIAAKSIGVRLQEGSPQKFIAVVGDGLRKLIDSGRREPRCRQLVVIECGEFCHVASVAGTYAAYRVS